MRRDVAILGESVLAAKRMIGEQKDRSLTVDTPVPYRIGDLVKTSLVAMIAVTRNPHVRAIPVPISSMPGR